MPRKAPVYTHIEYTPTGGDEADLADGVLGVTAAAEFCGHKRSWMEERLALREIPSFLLDRRRVIPKRALVRWLAEEMRKANTGGA